MPERLDSSQMALRVAQELTSGEAVALGLGLPTLLPEVVSPGSGLLFVSESGALGYQMRGESALDSEGRTAGFVPGGVSVSTVELAAMIRAGYVDAVVLQAGQVTVRGGLHSLDHRRHSGTVCRILVLRSTPVLLCGPSP